MRVRELIKILNGMDPELEVLIPDEEYYEDSEGSWDSSISYNNIKDVWVSSTNEVIIDHLGV